MFFPTVSRYHQSNWVCPWVVGVDTCSGTSPAQFGVLKDLLATARKQNPLRALDMVLLTVGANDVNFAGLVANVNQDFPLDGTRASGTTGNDLAGAVANGQIPLGNFAVNPLNGMQILIGSATGNLYETINAGIQWGPIGTAGDFDGTQLSAIVYGAPDPNAPAGIGNLDNFIYVGTTGRVGGTKGHIYASQAGGQGWTDLSSGLDGASVVGIYPDPNRGSHAAYAVTLTGVFYSADTVGLAASRSDVIRSSVPATPRFCRAGHGLSA